MKAFNKKRKLKHTTKGHYSKFKYGVVFSSRNTKVRWYDLGSKRIRLVATLYRCMIDKTKVRED